MAVKQLKFVRSNGKSALGIHEYISRQGGHQTNVDKCLVTGSANLPEFAGGNPQLFWKMADTHERANAKRCTHIVLALPRELDVEAQARMVADFVSRNFKGCPLSWAIHEGKGQHNPHAHLQICERRIETERESKFSEKRFFKRNGVKKDRNLNARKFCSHLYRQYAGSINYHLQMAGSEERISVEVKNKAFEEMSLAEKINKNLQYELEEMEKRQAKEMAELQKKLNKEKENKGVEQENEFRRREQDAAGTESGNIEEAGESRSNDDRIDSEIISGGSHESGSGGVGGIQTGEGNFERSFGDNDSGSPGLGITGGSDETSGIGKQFAEFRVNFQESIRLALNALFKTKLFQKLRIFKNNHFSEDNKSQEKKNSLVEKIRVGVKTAFFGFMKYDRSETQKNIESELPLNKDDLESRYKFYKRNIRDKENVEKYFNFKTDLCEKLDVGDEAIIGISLLKKMDKEALNKAIETYENYEKGYRRKSRLSSSYIVLEFNYLLHQRICTDQDKKDEYYRISKIIVNKKRNSQDFSQELEIVWRMTREAVEALKEQRQPRKTFSLKIDNKPDEGYGRGMKF